LPTRKYGFSLPSPFGTGKVDSHQVQREPNSLVRTPSECTTRSKKDHLKQRVETRLNLPKKRSCLFVHGLITRSRLWFIMRGFFRLAADVIGTDHPVLAEELRRARPHWRHTHATHALARGAELTTVRDNVRHASIATTSIYLQSDEAKRSRQMDEAFPAP
jgi:hypothetical protein